jgi:tetratricopeptide (TPR) repeat protein
LEADPFNAQAHFGLANLYRAAGQSKRAIDHYHQSLDADPNSVPTYINLGALLQDEGRVEEAAVAFRKATQLRPDYAPAHFNLGNAYLADGRFREAEEAVGRALFLDDRLAPAHNTLGLLLLKQGREDEALASFRRSLEVDPDQVDARRNIANIKTSRGELDSAIEDYRQILALKPDDPDINLGLGDALVKTGKAAEALAHIDVKLALDPADATALSIKYAALAVSGDRESEAYLVDYEHLIGRREINDIGEFASLEGLNAALAEHVASQPLLREDKTTVHGLKTDEVLGGDEPAIALIRDFIHREIRHRIEHIAVDPSHPFAAGRPRKYRLRAWGVQMWQRGHQIPHIHPHAWLSGVYYVKLPRAVDSGEGNREGWIEFGKGVDSLFRRANPRTEQVRPKEGLLLTFPSYFWHRTIPFDTDEDRISIAFDVIPES